jgi:hypothetical protein
LGDTDAFVDPSSHHIAPGLVETPLTRTELEDPATRELFMSVIPMKRAVASQEIAEAAVFLASDEARSINGHTIVIDGDSLTRGYPALLTGAKSGATITGTGRRTTGKPQAVRLCAQFLAPTVMWSACLLAPRVHRC